MSAHKELGYETPLSMLEILEVITEPNDGGYILRCKIPRRKNSSDTDCYINVTEHFVSKHNTQVGDYLMSYESGFMVSAPADNALGIGEKISVLVDKIKEKPEDEPVRNNEQTRLECIKQAVNIIGLDFVSTDQSVLGLAKELFEFITEKENPKSKV